MPSQLVPVEVYGGVFVDSVELNTHTLAFPLRSSGKCLAIPTGSCGKKAFAAAGWTFFVGDPFNTPIVRKIDGAPASICERTRLCAGWIAQEKAPAEIRREFLTRARLFCSRHGNADHCREGRAERN